MQTNYQKQYGFTLIELMIVIAIIGILGVIAIPAYQVYTIRAKILETVNLSGAAKTFIWEEYFTNASMPEETSNAAKDVENMMMTSKYINDARYSKIDNNDASLQVTFKNIGSGADDSTMIFLFQTDLEKITLDCKGGTMLDMYRPFSCRSNS